MSFEYDPDKNKANKLKHGIDFEEAQALWDDERRLEAPALTQDEPRFIVTGQIDDKYWTAVYTNRDDNIRIISVRCARQKEIEAYEGN